jgi:hypothetical protein
MSYIAQQPKFANVTTRAQSADPANPVEGMVFYADGTSRTRGLWQYIQGSWQQVGASAGGLDVAFQLVANELITDWASGNNASFLGGGTLGGTFVKNTTTPLNGTADYRYTQAAGSLNDYIASPAQSIPVKFRGNIATVFFNYQYNGGNSDIEFVVYDVTNAAKLTIPANSLVPVPLQTTGVYKVNLFIPANCASIRVGFQTKILNSGKILTFDDMVLSSDSTIYADVSRMTDWVNFTPTGSWVSNTTYSGKYRRVGDSAEIQFLATVTGAPTAASLTFNMPSGLVVDSTKLSGGSSGNYLIGTGTTVSAATSYYVSADLANSTTVIRAVLGGATATYVTNPAVVSNTVPGTYANTDFVYLTIRVPIVGWSAFNPNIVLQSESFSTDTAPLTYASSAAYTLTTLADAPVGTFITYTYAANTNTRVQTNSAPTQTTADMATNGIQLFARAYNAASTAAQPAALAIQIGKGMKGTTLGVYGSASRVSPGNLDYVVPGTTTEAGAWEKNYNEQTGILTIDVGACWNASTTSRVVMTNISASASFYLTISASRNPALTGINAPQAPTVQKFTSGSGTYTRPANVRYINVKMVGAGGGGGGGGTGSFGTGGAGGNTTFGSSLLVANGGAGGSAGSAPGAPGTVSLGTAVGTALTGGYGGMGQFNSSTTAYLSGGHGGSSPFGGAGYGGYAGVAAAAGSAISNTGSGGGGGAHNAGSTGASTGPGGSSGGYADAIITSPATSYSYTVGAAGTAGTAGTSGFAGGAGGSGYIIVTEYYY